MDQISSNINKQDSFQNVLGSLNFLNIISDLQYHNSCFAANVLSAQVYSEGGSEENIYLKAWAQSVWWAIVRIQDLSAANMNV